MEIYGDVYVLNIFKLYYGGSSEDDLACFPVPPSIL
jgi:hypothetical protein